MGPNKEELAIGVAKSKALLYPVLYKKYKSNNKIVYKVWPIAGRNEHLELTPAEWRSTYKVITQYGTQKTTKI